MASSASSSSSGNPHEPTSSGNQPTSSTMPGSTNQSGNSTYPVSVSLSSSNSLSPTSSASTLISSPTSTTSNLPPFTTSSPLSMPVSIPPTPPIGESNPLFSVLHNQQTFPTSTAAFLTSQQSVLPRALFPLTTPMMGIDQLASGLHGLNLSGGLIPSQNTTSPFFSSAFSAPNVTNLVMVKLSTVEDYLTWQTQFTALLISHNLLGFVDGLCPPPSMYTNGVQLNPHYVTWIRIDQSLRSWLFATLSREVLVEVHDLAHSFQIWDRLQRRFFTTGLARVMELKRTITTIKKSENQSMEAYLREIKVVADSLAAINSPLSDSELVQHTLFGLNSDYESLVTAVTYFGNNITFDDLRSKLILHEQRVRYLKERDPDVPHHQALIAGITTSGGLGASTATAASPNRANLGTQQQPPSASGGWRDRGSWRGGRGPVFRGGRGRTSSGGCGFYG